MNPDVQLFEDQKAWSRSTVRAFEHGTGEQGPAKRVLSIAATGAGKTIMGAGLAYYALKRWEPARVLFLADTDELIEQALEKIHWATNIPADREQGKHTASLRSKIVVGSIQTLQKPGRLNRFPQDHFGLVIADEAHLSMAAGWQRVLNHFDEGGSNSLGVTATPFRGDDLNLWDWWQVKGAEIGLFELIELGRLAPIRVKTVPLEFDVEIEDNPDSEELDDEKVRCAIEPAFDAILDAWEAEGEGRKTLWFLPGVEASKRFTQKLLDRGHTAAHIDGGTKNRKEVLAAYAAGRYDHLCNSDLLMKGYDQPDIECVVILKLTKSRVNYQQMVGRGTRVSPKTGKKDMLLLDFLFQFGDLGVCRPGDLIARTPKQAREINDQLARGKPLDLREARDLSENEAVNRLVEGLLKRRGRRGETYDAREAAALLNAPELLTYEPEQKWELDVPTPRQLDILARKGIDVSTIKTRGMASNLLTYLIKRSEADQATLKQVVTLARLGVQNGHQMTFAEASQTMDEAFSR